MTLQKRITKIKILSRITNYDFPPGITYQVYTLIPSNRLYEVAIELSGYQRKGDSSKRQISVELEASRIKKKYYSNDLGYPQ